ncbi:MAG TPA: hypothetical protein VIT90_07720 [Lysobacter sp.]
MSELDKTTAAFAAVLQADIRRERRLLVAEIVLLAVLVGLAVLRYWIGQ